MRNYRKMAACAALLVFLWGCAGPQAEQPATDQPTVEQPVMEQEPTELIQETEAPTEETLPQIQNEHEGYAVQTPVGTIYYPSGWEEYLDVRMSREGALLISFYAVMEDLEQPLFDLWFSHSDSTGAAGIAQGEGKDYYVGLSMYPFEPDAGWNEDQTDLVYSMQEAANSLMSQLNLLPIDNAQESEPEDMVIETAYGQLHYPGKWEKYLMVDQSVEDAAAFYALLPGKEPLLLFTVCFGEEETMAAITDQNGAETGVGIRFEEPVFDSSWTQDEIDTVYGMQEDINYLLNMLQQ